MHPANVKIILSNIRASDLYGTRFFGKNMPIAIHFGRCRKDFSVNEMHADLLCRCY